MVRYSELAMRTAKPMEPNDDMMHAALGISGEAGEFADAVKKVLVYGKQPDMDNLIEELGDLLWYINLAAVTLGVDFNEICTRNINKLLLRYPEKYSDKLAEARMDKTAKEIAVEEATRMAGWSKAEDLSGNYNTHGDKDAY